MTSTQQTAIEQAAKAAHDFQISIGKNPSYGNACGYAVKNALTELFTNPEKYELVSKEEYDKVMSSNTALKFKLDHALESLDEYAEAMGGMVSKEELDRKTGNLSGSGGIG